VFGLSLLTEFRGAFDVIFGCGNSHRVSLAHINHKKLVSFDKKSKCLCNFPHSSLLGFLELIIILLVTKLV
jgi:hypothetical protein